MTRLILLLVPYLQEMLDSREIRLSYDEEACFVYIILMPHSGGLDDKHVLAIIDDDGKEHIPEFALSFFEATLNRSSLY